MGLIFTTVSLFSVEPPMPRSEILALRPSTPRHNITGGVKCDTQSKIFFCTIFGFPHQKSVVRNGEAVRLGRVGRNCKIVGRRLGEMPYRDAQLIGQHRPTTVAHPLFLA